MKKINENDRKIVNLKTARFIPNNLEQNGETGTSFIKLNPDMPTYSGFYIYKMEAGSSSQPHRHTGAEEFYVIEGTLHDHDGTIYRQGDIVWLAPGTVHNSYSETGCVLAVFSEQKEDTQNL